MYETRMKAKAKASKAKEPVKRKTLKQKDVNRGAKMKNRLKDQSMLTTLLKVDEASKADQDYKASKLAEASKGITGKVQLVNVKETDQKDADNNPAPDADDGKLKDLGMSPPEEVIMSSDEDNASHHLVLGEEYKDLESFVLSDEYEFNLFDDIIDNIEMVEEYHHPVTQHAYVFGKPFIPMDANEMGSIAEMDVSVIDDSSYFLP